jgi:glycosyltransferase involved in cell wall biosynthesis
MQALVEPAASGVRCVIVGDGEARTSIEAKISALGLSKRVSLLGRVDDSTLINHLARCRFVCCPSEQEDYGLVTAEAFSSAKAVITCTDSGGHAELVEHGTTGLIVEPSAQALADALGRLMDDVATAERWGEFARRKAETMTWKDTVDRLLLV